MIYDLSILGELCKVNSITTSVKKKELLALLFLRLQTFAGQASKTLFTMCKFVSILFNYEPSVM